MVQTDCHAAMTVNRLAMNYADCPVAVSVVSSFANRTSMWRGVGMNPPNDSKSAWDDLLPGFTETDGAPPQITRYAI